MSQGYAQAPQPPAEHMVGSLPFTGLDIWVFIVVAVMVLITAAVLRRFGK